MSEERLQKILARAGVASRRAAEAIIQDGRVRVNGKIVTELGSKADPRKDKVELDGNRLVAESLVYVVLNKPRGVVSTVSDPEGRATVKDFLADLTERVYPVGRLDYATSGVLLATNDGTFSDGLLHPKREVPKTYVVKVQGVMTDDDLRHWSHGVKLEDGVTKAAKVGRVRLEGDKTWFELTIKEGRNQQIRRMGEATGFKVMRLVRTEFAGIDADGLRPGGWRHLTRGELETLKKEFGVPKSLPSVISDETGPLTARGRVAGVDAHGRAVTPRFGGGSPGRRNYEVKEDWGGGAGRGRTRAGEGTSHPPSRTGRSKASGREGASRGAGSAPPRGGPPGRGSSGEARPDPVSPGRGGLTRTTGSGGGIGASGDGGGYRMQRGRGSPSSGDRKGARGRR